MLRVSSVNLAGIQGPFEGLSSLWTWIEDQITLCQPDQVKLCNGSKREYDDLCDLLVQNGTFQKLNPDLRPDSYLACSDPSDVARVEDRTFICTPEKANAGPTNNWMPPAQMIETLLPLFRSCMKGRTLYIVPFCMGPLDSPYSQYGIEITDSPYVVVSMKVMTRMGTDALNSMKNAFNSGEKQIVRCLHSVGMPLADSAKSDVRWPCNKEQKYITHFPEENMILSFGSGYGGNALLGKKCFALRIASNMGRTDGWYAEHMLILGVEGPGQKKHYVAAAFPSACGKTNFAMLLPPEPLNDWAITTLGDDIAWIYPASDGKLMAINPEAGYFGVAPGTSMKTNPNAMLTMTRNTIFTNVALTENGDVWWEGMTTTPPEKLTDWRGEAWTPGCGRPAAHPNARFTTALEQCPSKDTNWNNKEGVEISAFIFGGRRTDTTPLVTQAKSWEQGVYMAATVGSETTAAATGTVGVVRRDPFAMLPFCGYNMADYFAHWISMKSNANIAKAQTPPIFVVNWFKKNSDGKFIWPGYSDNLRVLKWIVQRVENKITAVETPIGHRPRMQDLDLRQMNLSTQLFEDLFVLDEIEWKKEILSHIDFLSLFGEKVPKVFAEIQKQMVGDLLHNNLGQLRTNDISAES